MIKQINHRLPYYQYPHLAMFPELFHGHFSRSGGQSLAPYDGLNVGFDIGDDSETVRKNRHFIAQCYGQELPLLEVKQVHGTNVHIPEDQKGQGGEIITADAVVTAEKGLMLLIKTADCQPVFLYDPVKQVVGNIHSGWKGSVANIIAETLFVMTKRFNCVPADILAGVGPSLGPCCAEFIHYESEIPEKYWTFKDHNHHMDFWSVSCEQLIELGVKSENVVTSRLCTACLANKDLFFSYRRDKVTGRLANVIGLV